MKKRAYALLMLLITSLSAQAEQIVLGEDLELRQKGANTDEYMRVGKLAKGSVIEIPDRYIKRKANGDVDLYATRENWRKQASAKESRPGWLRYNGDERANFYPIRVVKAELGSTSHTNEFDDSYFMGLEGLYVRGNLKKNVSQVSVNKPILAAGGGETTSASALKSKPAEKPKLIVPTEAVSDDICIDGGCSQPGTISKLRAALEPAFQKVAEEEQRMAARTDLANANTAETLKRNFAQTCGGKLEDFLPIVKKRSEEEGVPYELLTHMLLQESSARCFAANPETDLTSSIGLFQVNTSSSTVRHCSEADRRIITTTAPSQLAQAPQCLQNPLVNLNEAMRILKEKKNILVEIWRLGSVSKFFTAFEPSKMSNKTHWELAVAAYNGGEGHVLAARREVEQFNKRHNANLNPNNTDAIHFFMLWGSMSPKEQQELIGRSYSGRRTDLSVLNVAYVRNLRGALSKDIAAKVKPAVPDKVAAEAIIPIIVVEDADFSSFSELGD